MINNDVNEIANKIEKSRETDSSRKKRRFNQFTHKKDIKRRIGETVLSILEDYKNPHDALRFFYELYTEMFIEITDCSISDITGIVGEILETLIKLRTKHG